MAGPSDRQAAILRARAELQRQPVYLDTETTGLDDKAEIVEIGIVDHDGRILVDTLVKPTGKIPFDATAVHGITDEMGKAAPTWPDVWPQVESALAGKRVAIYNADYDLRLMRQSHRKHGMAWQFAENSAVCVMLLYAQFYGARGSRYGTYRWHRLEEAGRQCRLTLPNAHRAAADALLARAVLHYMAGRIS